MNAAASTVTTAYSTCAYMVIFNIWGHEDMGGGGSFWAPSDHNFETPSEGWGGGVHEITCYFAPNATILFPIFLFPPYITNPVQ